MKLIDLLNKIFNGELKDKTKIKFGLDIYEYWEEDKKIHAFSKLNETFSAGITRVIDSDRLDEEVEIIEEDKEIIEITKEEFERLDKRTLLELIVKNQNELIKAVNELKKGK